MTFQKSLNNYLSGLEEKYQVSLDNVQVSALESLLEFISGSERSICLSGKAGCGKTLLLSMLSDILTSQGYTI